MVDSCETESPFNLLIQYYRQVFNRKNSDLNFYVMFRCLHEKDQQNSALQSEHDNARVSRQRASTQKTLNSLATNWMLGQSDIAYLPNFDVNCNIPTLDYDVINDVIVKIMFALDIICYGAYYSAVKFSHCLPGSMLPCGVTRKN